MERGPNAHSPEINRFLSSFHFRFQCFLSFSFSFDTIPSSSRKTLWMMRKKAFHDGSAAAELKAFYIFSGRITFPVFLTRRNNETESECAVSIFGG